MIIHRNSQKRIYKCKGIYFITFNTYNRFSYFTEKTFREIFYQNLIYYQKRKGFILFDNVLDNNHSHLLFKPGKQYNYSNVMHSIKRVTSYQINWVMKIDKGEDLGKGEHLDVRLSNRDQLKSSRYEFRKKYGFPQYVVPKFKWQKSFHFHLIEDKEDFLKHLNYVRNHKNYCRSKGNLL